MMKRVIAGLVLSTGLALGVAADAHHSFAATYNESEMIELEGDLVQFMWRNPHSFVHIMVENDQGEMERWAAEWGGGGQLANQGVARDSLGVGDRLVITGNPSRTDGDRRLRVRVIYRPSDGWRYGGEFD